MANDKYKGSHDARGKRTTQSDSRVSEKAKADLPAYGFNNMTVGQIKSERKRVDKERRPQQSKKWYE
jgi:hypothetical protein